MDIYRAVRLESEAYDLYLRLVRQRLDCPWYAFCARRRLFQASLRAYWRYKRRFHKYTPLFEKASFLAQETEVDLTPLRVIALDL